MKVLRASYDPSTWMASEI